MLFPPPTSTTIYVHVHFSWIKLPFAIIYFIYSYCPFCFDELEGRSCEAASRKHKRSTSGEILVVHFHATIIDHPGTDSRRKNIQKLLVANSDFHSSIALLSPLPLLAAGDYLENTIGSPFNSNNTNAKKGSRSTLQQWNGSKAH